MVDCFLMWNEGDRECTINIAALVRLREIRDYIRETVAEAFRGLNERGVSLSKSRVSTVVSEAINDTFVVFEGYA